MVWTVAMLGFTRTLCMPSSFRALIAYKEREREGKSYCIVDRQKCKVSLASYTTVAKIIKSLKNSLSHTMYMYMYISGLKIEFYWLKITCDIGNIATTHWYCLW